MARRLHKCGLLVSRTEHSIPFKSGHWFHPSNITDHFGGPGVGGGIMLKGRTFFDRSLLQGGVSSPCESISRCYWTRFRFYA
ncbi:hypothetical protein TNCV_682781 [Trichonephila clavipes]|nr:hypothetical protein TNCV_682781 [Trichonephila clavipes]